MSTFIVLIYQGSTPTPAEPERWSRLSPEEQKAIYADYAALSQAPGVTPGLPLGTPGQATTVTVAEGRTVTRPGPSSDAPLGGYFVVEAEDLDAAVAFAARIPAARHGGCVEVRPCATYW